MTRAVVFRGPALLDKKSLYSHSLVRSSTLTAAWTYQVRLLAGVGFIT